MKLKHLISTSALIFAGIPSAQAGDPIFMCKSCPAGTYSNGGSSTSCTPCPAGQYQSATGATSCGYCNTGYYSTGGAKSCTACTNKPANSYYTGRGTSNSCPWACNAGYYKDGNTCKPCGYGKYSTAGTVGYSNCKPCNGFTKNVTTDITVSMGSKCGYFIDEDAPEGYCYGSTVNTSPTSNIGKSYGDFVQISYICPSSCRYPDCGCLKDNYFVDDFVEGICDYVNHSTNDSDIWDDPAVYDNGVLEGYDYDHDGILDTSWDGSDYDAGDSDGDYGGGDW